MTIVPIDEIEIPEPRATESKYRRLLDEFIEADMTKGKITSSCIAEAEAIQKGLIRYRRIDELILIERRGNIIWLAKLT